MFGQLQQKRWVPSPQAGFVGMVLGVFALGVGIGKIAAGSKPWDWTLTIANLSALAFYTCWFGIAVMRTLPKRKAAE